MTQSKNSELNEYSTELEKKLRSNITDSPPSLELLIMRIKQTCLNNPTPSETFLYYFAKNFIMKKNDTYSEDEAKLLVFCAPLHVSSFILEKF